MVCLTVIQANSLKKPCSTDSGKSLKFDIDTGYAVLSSTARISRRMNRNEFEITIKTTKRSGLILSMIGPGTGKKDYLMISLIKGHVELNCDLGGYHENRINLISDRTVDDGNWHFIRISRNKTVVQLTTDNRWKGRYLTDSYYQLNTDGQLRLGKTTNVPVSFSEEYKTGFDGYVRNVKIGKMSLSVKDIIGNRGLRKCSSKSN
ncbi:Uncharacterised protein g10523 [Pycnogonum litorale]